MFDSLLRSLGSPPAKKQPKDRRKANSALRLGLESLEERTLLTAGAQPGVHLLQPNGLAPLASGSLPGGFSPAQIRHAYGFDQITFNNGAVQGDGTGQTIAIIDAYDQPNLASDLATFDSTYGIAAPPSFTKVNETGGSSLPAASASWGLEESLDVEWAHAIAPGAKILLVEASSNSFSDLFAAVDYARNQPGVAVVSMSFGGSEFSGMNSFDSYFTTPSGHSGVTFVASSGDSGSSGAPNYPSVSPNVLAVGGTQLTTDSLGNYLSETGWSGSGGGISAYYSQPAYQKGVVTQSSTMRTVPDVAYNGSGSSPFAVYDTGYGGWVQVYGTSAGAPQWAALVAIADQGRALAGQGALDGASQTLPTLYQLPAADFHDITSGSNGAYSAGPGYDLVTGRGSPVANAIVSGLVNAGSSGPGTGPTVVTPASASPSTVTGTTTGLSVTASDPAGAASLTYTWSVTAAPSGVKLPTFSVNGTNAASFSTATFYAAGNYTFQVTIKDTSNLTATSSVSVSVMQTPTSISVSPANSSVSDGKTLQYSATATDQFGNALAAQPGFTWSLGAGGMGSISSTGLYTAPTTGSGTVTIQASGGGLSGSAAVNVGAAPAAPSNLTAVVNSSHYVVLSWTDNSSNQSGFVIQRSTNGGAWVQIATVGASATSYTDKSVNKRRSYTYRIYAYNSFGNSPYSNVTKAVTPSVVTAKARTGGSVAAGLIVSALKSIGSSDKTPVVVEVTATGLTIGSLRTGGGVVAGSMATSPTGTAMSAAAADALWELLGSDPVEELFGSRLR
jgi:subtilase family serine protease